jgi:hypothetical protein
MIINIFNLTGSDLTAKSSRDLCALFTLATNALQSGWCADATPQTALALIAMIKAEQAKRGPAP